MLYIYSKDNINHLNKEFIYDVERRFDYIYKDILEMKNFKNIIKEIDNADFIDGDIFKGKFGTCSLSDISTGCKAVLLSYYYGADKIINFVECGDNALNCANNLDKNCYGYLDRPFIFSDSNSFIYYNGDKVDSLSFRKSLSSNRNKF